MLLEANHEGIRRLQPRLADQCLSAGPLLVERVLKRGGRRWIKVLGRPVLVLPLAPPLPLEHVHDGIALRGGQLPLQLANQRLLLGGRQ